MGVSICVCVCVCVCVDVFGECLCGNVCRDVGVDCREFFLVKRQDFFSLSPIRIIPIRRHLKRRCAYQTFTIIDEESREERTKFERGKRKMTSRKKEEKEQ